MYIYIYMYVCVYKQPVQSVCIVVLYVTMKLCGGSARKTTVGST